MIDLKYLYRIILVLASIAVFLASVYFVSGYLNKSSQNEIESLKQEKTDILRQKDSLIQINLNLLKQDSIYLDSVNEAYEYLNMEEDGYNILQRAKIKAINRIMANPLDSQAVNRAIADLKRRYEHR